MKSITELTDFWQEGTERARACKLYYKALEHGGIKNLSPEEQKEWFGIDLVTRCDAIRVCNEANAEIARIKQQESV